MIRRSPITRKVRVKPRRTGKPRRSARVYSQPFLDFCEDMPCFICYREAYALLAGAEYAVEAIQQPIYGRQKSRTEPAHLGLSTDRRGLSQKFSDTTAGPLCGEHHRTGADSIHVLDADKFFAHHGMDRDDTVRMVQKLFRESLQ